MYTSLKYPDFYIYISEPIHHFADVNSAGASHRLVLFFSPLHRTRFTGKLWNVRIYCGREKDAGVQSHRTTQQGQALGQDKIRIDGMLSPGASCIYTVATSTDGVMSLMVASTK